MCKIESTNSSVYCYEYKHIKTISVPPHACAFCLTGCAGLGWLSSLLFVVRRRQTSTIEKCEINCGVSRGHRRAYLRYIQKELYFVHAASLHLNVLWKKRSITFYPENPFLHDFSLQGGGGSNSCALTVYCNCISIPELLVNSWDPTTQMLCQFIRTSIYFKQCK